MRPLFLSFFLVCSLCWSLIAGEGNRFSYLEGCNTYAPSGEFPKLITPQWIGEKDVEAVVILAIDDLSDPAKYEAYMRPILNQLKKIDGRAPISVMTNKPKWDHSQLQQWLEEGLSIDVHTVDHPCPLFNGGDFNKAKSTYDRCIDLLNQIPGNKPVAYRMPCCDSQNTVSPRFYSEIFNKTTESGKFLQASSSVFTVFTSDENNSDVPKELLFDPDGKSKFQKYLPNKSRFGNLYLNYVENYPYPYVINRLCWEFPSLVPSDWSAQNYSKPNNPDTLRDFKTALDITVHKKGVLTLTFHPHGWISNSQMVEFVDYAQKKYGSKINFLTFPETLERMKTHMLDGHAIRNSKGTDNDVRILDVNGDGFMDVLYVRGFVRGQSKSARNLVTKIWNPAENQWDVFRNELLDSSFSLAHAHFGQLDKNVSSYVTTINTFEKSELLVYSFGKTGWESHSSLEQLKNLYLSVNNDSIAKLTFNDVRFGLNKDGVVKRDYRLPSAAFRFHDINNDGVCEIIVSSRYLKCLFQYSGKTDQWKRLPFNLPAGTMFLDDKDNDAGFRFVDINSDGKDDIVFSNNEYYSAHFFVDMQSGWSQKLLSGKRGDKKTEEEIPMIVRENGADNGVWFSRGFMWVQNEDTNKLPDYLDRREFKQWLK